MQEVIDKIGEVSLSEAINIIKIYGEDKLPYSGGANANLFVALKEAKIIAKGFFQHDLITISKKSEIIPVEHWRSKTVFNYMSPLIAWLQDKPSYASIVMSLDNLEKWLRDNDISQVKQVGINNGILDLDFLKTYYSRYVTDSSIKVYTLASLVIGCDPIGNINTSEAVEFRNDLADSRTPIGLIFDKLKYGMLLGKIPIVIKADDIEHNAINLVHALDWLEPELKATNISIHIPLKFYVNEIRTSNVLKDAKQTPFNAVKFLLPHQISSISPNKKPENSTPANHKDVHADSPKRQGKRGVKRIDKDNLLVEEMHTQIKKRKFNTIDAAAGSLIDKATGAATPDNKRRRLARKFTEKYGSDLDSIKQ